MDYEKKYKEALERAKGMWEQGMMPERVEYIFPELKESEDERIRKDIIRVFKGEISFTAEEDNKKYIAWLEKQGEQQHINSKDDERLRKTTVAFLKDFAEQGYENAVECIDWLEKQVSKKPADKVEPKFHEGDWIISDTVNKDYQICKIIGIIINNLFY